MSLAKNWLLIAMVERVPKCSPIAAPRIRTQDSESLPKRNRRACVLKLL